MAKNSPSLNTSVFLSGFIILLYLCLGFIPNWQAVDKIAPQWLAMTILNGISLIFIGIHRSFYWASMTSTLRSIMSMTYIGFIVWAAFSYFYAINPTEVLVNITRQVNVMLMYLFMGIMLFSFPQKMKFVSWVIVFILGIEVYAVLVEAQEMINTTGVISSGSLKGVTANRNITAFSLAIKVPFVLFLLYTVKRKITKAALTFLVFLAFVCLTMIQSRASFIAVGFTTLGYLLLNLYLYLIHRKKKFIYQSGYLMIPLLFAIVVNQTYLSKKGADAVSRAATISVSTNDGSVNQRLRYYEDVLTHLSSHPIFGVGLGNWKLKSIDYDKRDIVGYVVPYHAHSDFIQLGAELGIFGFLLYLGIFIWAVYFAYRLIRFSSLSETEKIFVFLLLIALGVYSVDANLNFPIARPQVLVVWAVIMALIMGYYQSFVNPKKELRSRLKINSVFMLLALGAILPSVYVTNQVYKSLKGQMFLLQDFNSNQYNVSLNQVDTIVPEIPNITVTTIPINAVKARYFVNAKQYEKALVYIDKGIPANPYLFYGELLKSQIYQAQGKIDSAKVYAKKAFFGLPNNALHASNYINLINQTRDREALEEAFELMTAKNEFNNWKNYLIVALGLYPEKDSLLTFRAKQAESLFPNNQDITNLYRQIAVGINGINKATAFSNAGLSFFNQGDYQNAAQQFELAIENNNLDYANFENAATSNYLLGNLEKALEQIDVVINEMNPLNGKCEYIKALIYIRMGDPIGACPLLETAKDSGFAQAATTAAQYCK